jgi:hypothetical protein
MCTNDFYLCKDSSRINCTLACSTLGYIPCKNYVDKKICGSVNRKLVSMNKQHVLLNSHDDKFRFSNLLGRTFKGSDLLGDNDNDNYFTSSDKVLSSGMFNFLYCWKHFLANMPSVSIFTSTEPTGLLAQVKFGNLDEPTFPSVPLASNRTSGPKSVLFAINQLLN